MLSTCCAGGRTNDMSCVLVIALPPPLLLPLCTSGMYGSSSPVILIMHSRDARRAPGLVVIKHTVSVVVEPTESTGIASSVIHQRSAFDVFTACNPRLVSVQSMNKRHKYEQSVRAAGDQFFPVPFTPSGTPYVEAVDFLRKISHSGDTLPANAGRDAPRFIHESTRYVTTTHINHTTHASHSGSMLRA